MPSDTFCSADKNKGLLLVDASVAPQEITYPRELDLLNGCRERTERIIDELYIPAPGKRRYDLGLVKPKTMAASESWIAVIFFVMNIAHWWRLCFFLSFFRRLICQISAIFKELVYHKPRYGVIF